MTRSSCKKCGRKKTYKQIKMSNGKKEALCKTCHEAWSKLFNKKYPKGVGEPRWSELWDYFLRGYDVWSVS